MPFTKGHKINIGRIQTEEHRRNSGLAGKGRKFSSEHKAKISKRSKGNKYALGHKGVYGEKNIMWKGDKAGTAALHKWISVALGNPKKCEICFIETAKKYEWSSKSHKYLRKIED